MLKQIYEILWTALMYLKKFFVNFNVYNLKSKLRVLGKKKLKNSCNMSVNNFISLEYFLTSRTLALFLSARFRHFPELALVFIFSSQSKVFANFLVNSRPECIT